MRRLRWKWLLWRVDRKIAKARAKGDCAYLEVTYGQG
jgi:hypothetical protein